ncbi:MAG: acyl-CoA dehydrogenase family protein [Proteobacteria bacterium]|nr:acyl-CoA dehydrogenase family protein [Pseudomonadota bacterium]
MNFELSEEQRIFRDQVRAFAECHLKGGALARAHSGSYPRDIARLMAANGLFGIALPEAVGGQGGALLDSVIALEEVSLACPRSGDVIQAGNFGAIRTFAEYATADQRQRYLKPLLAGEMLISVAMTEPDAGSAVTDLKSALKADGEGWRLSGSKVFVTNSEEADLFLVYCRYGPGVEGIGSVLLERGAEGFEIGRPSQYMNGESWCPLFFDGVYVPPENVLLGRGGFKKQISGFNVERLGNATRAQALGRYCFNQARDYALSRQQFGRPLCEFQGIQWKFAEMEIQLEAARLLLYRAATRAETGLPSAQDTSIAKAMCNLAGHFAANESMQVMGGMGYSADTLVEWCLRKTRGWLIAGGSLEMMKNRIAEGIFERRFSQRPPRAGARAGADG